MKNPKRRTLKRSTYGKLLQAKATLKNQETVKSSNSEESKTIFKAKVALNKILDLSPKFKAKVLCKGLHDLNVELKVVNKGTTYKMDQLVDLQKGLDETK